MGAGVIKLLGAERVVSSQVPSELAGWWSHLGCRGDELASAGELLGASGAAIGEQAVVPDAVKALGQHVHEMLAFFDGHAVGV